MRLTLKEQKFIFTSLKDILIFNVTFVTVLKRTNDCSSCHRNTSVFPLKKNKISPFETPINNFSVFSCRIYAKGWRGNINNIFHICSNFLKQFKKRSKQFARHSNTLAERIYICCESHHEIWPLRGLVGKLE